MKVNKDGLELSLFVFSGNGPVRDKLSPNHRQQPYTLLQKLGLVQNMVKKYKS